MEEPFDHLVMMDSESGLDQTLFAGDLRTLLLGDHNGDERMAQSRRRAHQIVRRIVIGALYTLQRTTNFVTRDRTLKRRHVGRHGPPTHRVTTIGRPVKVDCSGWVRGYIDGATDDRDSPMFQSVVRGHYKRQVVGVGRTDRKVIWIEPYWRGPEESPILVRPYVVGNGKVNSDE